MPEKTVRKVFEAIKALGITPILGANNRTIFFSPAADALPKILKAAAKISSEKGHTYVYKHDEIGIRSITIHTGSAELKRRK